MCFCLVLLLMLFVIVFVWVVVDIYCFDLVYMWVLFLIDYVGYLQVMGMVLGSEGCVWFDFDNWCDVIVEVDILVL